MTPFELYLERKSTEAKFARENSVNIAILNAFMSYAGSKTSIDVKDFLGIAKPNLMRYSDFGNLEQFRKYLATEEAKEQMKLIDNY